jgi:hypothetical protein
MIFLFQSSLQIAFIHYFLFLFSFLRIMTSQEHSSFFLENHIYLLEKLKHFQELHEIHQHFYDYGNKESANMIRFHSYMPQFSKYALFLINKNKLR